jgi:hypothetical protein
MEGDESLQCDELIAEIDQRVTQLESILGRYTSRFNPTLLQPQTPKNGHPKPLKPYNVI